LGATPEDLPVHDDTFGATLQRVNRVILRARAPALVRAREGVGERPTYMGCRIGPTSHVRRCMWSTFRDEQFPRFSGWSGCGTVPASGVDERGDACRGTSESGFQTF